MAVMLRSTNPAAVNEIDPTRDRRRPYEGQRVIFHSRPGEARMGKQRAIADVLTVEDDDHVELLIHYAADDALVRWKIPRKTDQNPFNSWSFNEWDEIHYQPGEQKPAALKPEGHFTWDDVSAMHTEIGHLRSRVAALEAKPRRGRPPKEGATVTDSGAGHDPAGLGEIEGAEFASEFRDELSYDK